MDEGEGALEKEEEAEDEGVAFEVGAVEVAPDGHDAGNCDGDGSGQCDRTKPSSRQLAIDDGHRQEALEREQEGHGDTSSVARPVEDDEHRAKPEGGGEGQPADAPDQGPHGRIIPPLLCIENQSVSAACSTN